MVRLKNKRAIANSPKSFFGGGWIQTNELIIPDIDN